MNLAQADTVYSVNVFVCARAIQTNPSTPSWMRLVIDEYFIFLPVMQELVDALNLECTGGTGSPACVCSVCDIKKHVHLIAIEK